MFVIASYALHADQSTKQGRKKFQHACIKMFKSKQPSSKSTEHIALYQHPLTACTMTRTSSASFIHSGHLKQPLLLSNNAQNLAALLATAAVTHAVCFGSRSKGSAMAMQEVQHLVHEHGAYVAIEHIHTPLASCLVHTIKIHAMVLRPQGAYHTPAASKPGTCCSHSASRTTCNH
eukprot:1147818-Pelagomonas_calceolata.AAC.4